MTYNGDYKFMESEVNKPSLTGQVTAVCTEILTASRNRLYLDLRFLDLALSSLRWQITTEAETLGTDGRILFYHPDFLTGLYRRNPLLINRIYLHQILHCLFRHPFKPHDAKDQLWHLSCDIAAEAIIDQMTHCRSLRTGINGFRKDTTAYLKKDCPALSAESIYRFFCKNPPTESLFLRLVNEFCHDDHSLWPGLTTDDEPPPAAIEVLSDQWKDISEKTQTNMETFSRDNAPGSGNLEQQLQAENRPRTDYRTFLKKFSVWREENRIDPDSFDYVFYSYGLTLYENMPLIEPQETREVKKIEDFVIVLDTSMSCSGDLIREFLNQTYSVLSARETFFSKVHLHILQCDEQIQADTLITNRDEFTRYVEDLKIIGGGGTDFRPAFAYTDQLLKQKKLLQLKGLIYFTDGLGTFPVKKPPYQTAFIFLRENYEDAQVPPWALKLILEKQDLEEKTLRPDLTFLWNEDQE